MTQQLDGGTIRDEPSIIPHFIQLILDHGNSITEGSVAAARESQRDQIVQGVENLPHDGGVIVVANHFVTDTSLDLEQKWDQTMEHMGLISQAVNAASLSDQKMLWVAAVLPKSALQFGAVLPSDKIRRSVLTSAPDVIPIDYDDRRNLHQTLDKVSRNLRVGNVIGTFSEGRTRPQLGRAETGFAHFAIKNNSVVHPVAVYGDGHMINVNFGRGMYPPMNLTGKQDFTTSVMSSLAAMLPEKFRGYYR